MEKMTSHQVKNEYLNAMGEENGELFHHLSSEFAWIYVLWNEYKIIFREKNYDILNKTAPGFFRIIKRQFIHDIVLGMCRINDPKESMGNKNLSIKRLVDIAKKGHRKNIKERLNEIDEKICNIKKYRHKIISHNDLETNLKKTASPQVKFEEIESCLFEINELLNYFKSLYGMPNTLYKRTKTSSGHSAALIAYLDIAKRVREKPNKWQMENGF